MQVLKLPNKSNPGSAVRAACSAAAFIPRIPFQSRWREINSSSKLCLLRLSLVGESWGGSVDLSKINLFCSVVSFCALFAPCFLQISWKTLLAWLWVWFCWKWEFRAGIEL